MCTEILCYVFRHLRKKNFENALQWNSDITKLNRTKSPVERTINVKKILAVINATYAVAKRKPEKIRLAGIRRGSNPSKPDFFRLSFRNCISCVNNCEDLLYIYFFIPQFKYMNLIYS